MSFEDNFKKPCETLKERNGVHGNFSETAFMADNLKQLIACGKLYGSTTPVQREALDMIAVKIARILSGNPHFADHWHDIQGYALLAEQELNHPIQADTPRHEHNEESRGKGFYGHALPSTPDEYR